MPDATTCLKRRCGAMRREVEFADIGFFLLRVVTLLGMFAWLSLAEEAPERLRVYYGISVYFAGYGLVLYLLLFLRPARKKAVYSLSFLFDLSFVYLLIVNSGGYESSFFIGFYLLTALHAFYFGPLRGFAAAGICAGVYFLGGSRVSPPDWIDFLLRASFLVLIALPIGLFSGKMRRDKEKIETLNAELLRSLEELKLLQDKLIRAEKLSALGRLTSDVAHEIRNPLTVVGGFAKRLEKRLPEGSKEKEHARTIVEEVARLERILKDILTFSREAKEHIRHADVNEIIAETGAAFADLCRERSVALAVEPAPGLPACLIDRDQVRQAVDNLVVNAVDAMSGGGTLTLRSRTDVEDGVRHVVIDVIDTGTGISRDQLDRIFEPFYSSKTTGHGTGLGLSICKKIMEEHRG
ncbi:MAG TPA: ATP-binding protein, partial [Candidatus Deferrimicrobium sp.]